MIIALFSFLLLGVFFFSFGKILTYLYPEKSIALTIIYGIVLLSTLSWVYSFFFPLNVYYEVGILLIALLNIGYLWLKKQINTTYKAFVFSKTFVLFSLIILLITVFSPFIKDHFGYYIPTIKWLNEEGLIKGIVNIHIVLGQQSPWHILQASLDSFIDPYLRLNGFLLWVFLLYIFEKKQFYFLLFMPVFLLFIQSPNQDLPVYIFSLIIVNEIYKENSSQFEFFFILSCWLFTIKPYAFCLPIFILYYFYKKGKNLYFLNKRTLFISVFLFYLFLAKNYLCTSNLLFPISNFNINTDWVLPNEIIEKSSQNAFKKTYDFKYSIKEINQFTVFQKIGNFIFLTGFKGVLHTLFLGISLLFTWFAFKQKNKIINAFLILGWIKIILIVLFSGQYRFFLDIIFIFVFIMILSLKISINKFKLTFVIGSLVVLFSFMQPSLLQKFIPSFKMSFLMQKPTWEQLYKPVSHHIESSEMKKVGNLNFYIPNYTFMLNCKLPSISNKSLREYHKLGVFPQKINADLQKGFYMKKLDENEKIELENLITSFSK